MKIINKQKCLLNCKPRQGDYFYHNNQLIIIVYDEAVKEYVPFYAAHAAIGKESFKTIEDLLSFYNVNVLYSDNNIHLVIEGSNIVFCALEK